MFSEYPRGRYVTGAPFTALDVLNGLDAMTGDHDAYAHVSRMPSERWDSVRAFIRERGLVRTEGQLTSLTWRGRRLRHWLRRGFR